MTDSNIGKIFLSPFRVASDLMRALIKPADAGAPSPWCLEMTALALVIPFIIVVLHIWDAQIVESAMGSELLVLHWLRASTDLVRTSVWVAICGTVWLSTTFLLAPNVRSLFSDRIIHLHAWATFVLLSIVVGGIPTELAKLVIGRARPLMLEKLGPAYFSPFNGTNLFESFPSGHSLMAGILLISFWIFLPRWKLLLVPLCLVFPISRVVAGVHYPTDVVAGLTIGILSAWWVARYMATRNIIFYLDKGMALPRV